MTITAVTRPHVEAGAGEYSNLPTAELSLQGIALSATIPPLESILSENIGRPFGLLLGLTYAGDSLAALTIAAHALEATIAANDTSYILPHRGEAIGILAAFTNIGSGTYIELVASAEPLEASVTEMLSSALETGVLTLSANALTAELTEHHTSLLITDTIGLAANAPTSEVSEIGPAESVLPTVELHLTANALRSESTGDAIPPPGARPWMPVTRPKPRKVSVASKQKTIKLFIEAHAPTCEVTLNSESLIPVAHLQFTRLEPDTLIDYDEERALDELQALMAVIQWTENRDALL